MRKLLTILILSLCCTLLGAQETATAVSGQESAGDEIVFVGDDFDDGSLVGTLATATIPV